MPRSVRRMSKSGIYHIMLRGNEQRDLFIDNEDRYRFLETLKDKLASGNFCLYAFCLMDNHVHLLVRESDQPVKDLIKRVGTSYVYYFNKKYERVGHLFQDRYRSEPVESEAYLISALRYIHMNPVKADMVKAKEEYVWSSYKEYLTEMPYSFIDREYIFDIFSNDRKKAKKAFIEFSRHEDSNVFIDVKAKAARDKRYCKEGLKLSRHETKEYIDAFLKEKGIKRENLKFKVSCEIRRELIHFIKLNTALSIREIAELLDINRGMVEKTIK